MNVICSTCSEENPPDAQFCSNCSAYLGWQLDTSPRPTPAEGTETAPDGHSQAIDVADPAPLHPQEPSDERDPFEASTLVTEATVPLDGEPAQVTVNVANTSTVVDSYLAELVDAPPWLDVRSAAVKLLPSTSGTLVAELRIVSPTLVPAQQLTLLLRVRNSTGRSAYHDVPLHVTVPVRVAPIELRAEPRLLRTRDLAPVVCTVVVDNSRSNRWAHVLLSASDPEGVIRATWQSQQLQVAPGGEAASELRLNAPPPDPGEGVSRTVTITATDGNFNAETTLTLAQSAPRAAIDSVMIRLDPSVLRLGGKHRGKLTAVVDNRRGDAPAQLSMRGYDAEKKLGFAFSPATLHVPPAQEASVLVTVTAPRTSPGQEVTRPLTILASDGHADVQADGSVVQLAPSRRSLSRILFTVLGGAAMMLGAVLPFVGNPRERGFQLTTNEMSEQISELNPVKAIPVDPHLGGLEHVVSIGLLLLILGALVIFGLTGTSGRLTRIASLLGAIVVIATVAGAIWLVGEFTWAPGAFLAFAGCVGGYIGGLLARR